MGVARRARGEGESDRAWLDASDEMLSSAVRLSIRRAGGSCARRRTERAAWVPPHASMRRRLPSMAILATQRQPYAVSDSSAEERSVTTCGEEGG